MEKAHEIHLPTVQGFRKIGFFGWPPPLGLRVSIRVLHAPLRLFSAWKPF
jgi:hypothetical protein